MKLRIPFPNVNGCAVEVWQWISNFIQYFFDLLIFNQLSILGQCELSQAMLIKEGLFNWWHSGGIVHNTEWCMNCMYKICIADDPDKAKWLRRFTGFWRTSHIFLLLYFTSNGVVIVQFAISVAGQLKIDIQFNIGPHQFRGAVNCFHRVLTALASKFSCCTYAIHLTTYLIMKPGRSRNSFSSMMIWLWMPMLSRVEIVGEKEYEAFFWCNDFVSWSI